jgi:hypothetical protein
MNHPRLFTLLFAFLLHGNPSLIAQQNGLAGGSVLHMHSIHTSFPDTGRSAGHVYDSVLYDAPGHYEDNSVLLVIPGKWKPQKKVNLVFWFHGWRNNIDTALNYYHLKEQFLASQRNAILVLAETAKNSPDSYGGKLEQPAMFQSLTEDILTELKKMKLVTTGCVPGNIILAGHSGAYRVIAKIVENGGMKIQELDLFDALYGETAIFDNWIRNDTNNRFINWYTNQGGGTDEVSLGFMDQLKKEAVYFALSEETAVSPQLLYANRVLFVHSARAHNDIIFDPDNFRLLLEGSVFLSALP